MHLSVCLLISISIVTILAFIVLLLTDPDKLCDPIFTSDNDDRFTVEHIVGSENPLDIDRMGIYTEQLENKKLQELVQMNDRKEIDVEEENKEFKNNLSHLDNSAVIGQVFDRDETKERKYITGDELLAYKMAHISVKNRNAIHNRTRFTSDNFRKYYQEELDQEESRVWWENDALEDET